MRIRSTGYDDQDAEALAACGAHQQRLPMSTIVIADQARIPVMKDLASFRRWATSPRLPERGWFSYLAGQIWVDLSMEQLSHNFIKMAVGTHLTVLARRERLGFDLGDRVLLTNAR